MDAPDASGVDSRLCRRSDVEDTSVSGRPLTVSNYARLLLTREGLAESGTCWEGRAVRWASRHSKPHGAAATSVEPVAEASAEISAADSVHAVDAVAADGGAAEGDDCDPSVSATHDDDVDGYDVPDGSMGTGAAHYSALVSDSDEF